MIYPGPTTDEVHQNLWGSGPVPGMLNKPSRWFSCTAKFEERELCRANAIPTTQVRLTREALNSLGKGMHVLKLGSKLMRAKSQVSR